jgi:Sortase domain
VVVLGLVITGAAGCAGGGAEGERVTQAAPRAAHSAVAGATSTRPEAGPARSTEVINFPSMEVPGDFQVAGHVDSRTGPAVFYRLRDLRPGEEIHVVRADHRVVRLEVDALASYPKQALPTEAVYGATTAPVLRLITCAGSFRDNLAVSATRVPDGKGVAR